MTAVVWSKCPTVRLLACSLRRVKGQLQASQASGYSAICPPVHIALVGETGQCARVRTRKGSALRRNADNSM